MLFDILLFIVSGLADEKMRRSVLYKLQPYHISALSLKSSFGFAAKLHNSFETNHTNYFSVLVFTVVGTENEKNSYV
jgi:hypothetical protein